MANDPRFASVQDLRIPKGASGFVLESVAEISGGVSEATAIQTYQPDKKFLNFYVKNGAASGDSRLFYGRLYLNGAGSAYGDCIRAFTIIDAALTGTWATGVHATCQLGSDATSNNSGGWCGVRATMAAEAVTRTMTGTYASLQVDSDVATGNTHAARAAFIRVADVGAVATPFFMNLDGITAGVSNACQSDTGAVGTPAYYLRVICPDGSTGYLCIYDGHS